MDNTGKAFQESPLLQQASRDLAEEHAPGQEGLAILDESGVLADEHAQEQEKLKASKAEKIQTVFDDAQKIKDEAAAAPKPKSVGDSVGAALKDFQNPATDTPEGKLARAAIGGAADALEGVANFGVHVADFVDNYFLDGNFIDANTKVDLAKKVIPEGNTALDHFTRSAAQFMIPFGAISKGAKALGMAENAYKTAATAGFVTDLLAFDGKQQNLVDLAQNVTGLKIPLANYLSHRGDESDMEGRLKNALTGLGFGVALEGVFRGAQWYRARSIAKEGLNARAKAIIEATHAENGKPAVEGKIDVNTQGQADVPLGDVLGEQRAAPAMEGVSPRDAITKKPAHPFEGRPVQPGAPAGYGPQGFGETFADAMIEKNKEVFKTSYNRISYKEVASLYPIKMDKLLKMTEAEIAASPHARKSNQAYMIAWDEVAGNAAAHVAAGNIDDASIHAMLQAEAYAQEFSWRHTRSTSPAAQTVGLVGEPIPPHIQEKALQDVIAMSGGKAQIQSDAKILSELTPEQRIKARDKMQFMSWGDALTAIRAGSLLRRPSTWLKNEAGNVTKLGGYNITKAVAPYMSARKSTGGIIGESKDFMRWFTGQGRGIEPVSPEGINFLFERKGQLAKVDISRLNEHELSNYQKAVAQTENAIERAVKTRVDPLEWHAALKGQGQAYIDQMHATLLGFGDAARVQYNKQLSGKLGLQKEAALQNKSTKINGKTVDQIKAEFDAIGNSKTELIENRNIMDGIAQTPVVGKMISKAMPILRPLGKVQMMGPQFLNSRDNFMKVVSYYGEIHALAFRQARMRFPNAEFDANEATKFAQAFDEFVSNPPAWAGRISDKPEQMGVAAKAAFENTFTEPLDGISQKFYEFLRTSDAGDGSVIARFSAGAAFLTRTLVPFIKTYINIGSSAIRHTPLAVMTDRYNAAVRQGGAEAQMARAQLAVGTTGFATTLATLHNADITGYGPLDPTMRGAWLKDHKPYRIKIGPLDVDLDMFGNITPMLKFCADWREISPHFGEDIDMTEASDLAGIGAWLVAQHFTPEMLTDSIGKFMEAYKTGDFSHYTADVMATMTPLTAQLGDINQAYFDNTARSVRPTPLKPGPGTLDTNSENPDALASNHWETLTMYLNMIKSKVPSLSGTLPADRNMFGEKRMYPPGLGRQVTSPIWGTKLDMDDPVLTEVFRLGYNGIKEIQNENEESGEVPLKLGMPARSFNKQENVSGFDKNLGIQLTPEEYDKYVQYSAGIYPDDTDTSGTLKEQLKAMFETDEYKDNSDQYKREMVGELIRGMRKDAKKYLFENENSVYNRWNAKVDAYVNQLTPLEKK